MGVKCPIKEKKKKGWAKETLQVKTQEKVTQQKSYTEPLGGEW